MMVIFSPFEVGQKKSSIGFAAGLRGAGFAADVLEEDMARVDAVLFRTLRFAAAIHATPQKEKPPEAKSLGGGGNIFQIFQYDSRFGGKQAAAPVFRETAAYA